MARYAWPAAVAAVSASWYAADSLRHRRESGHGYDLHGAELEVGSDDFMRAAEALTGAPISWGNDAELLINGDRIFPCYLKTIREAQETICLLTYVYWRGEIAHDVADALCERAQAGVECNVLIDAVGGMKLEDELIERMTRRRRAGRPLPPAEALRGAAAGQPHAPQDPRRRRVHGLTGGVGIAEEWTGDAEDPDHWRDTHVRVDGPVARGLFGAFAENWLEATGEVLVGPDYLPDVEEARDGGPMMVVRSSAGRRRLQHRGALLPRDRHRARDARHHRGLLRAASGVRRGAGRPPSAASGCACSCPVTTSTSRRSGSPAGRATTTCSRRRRDLRVPADDAPRQDDDRGRRLVGGRVGELRQPLLPAQRRGDAVRHLARVRGRADRAVRARPRGARTGSSPSAGCAAARRSGRARRCSSSRAASCDQPRRTHPNRGHAGARAPSGADPEGEHAGERSGHARSRPRARASARTDCDDEHATPRPAPPARRRCAGRCRRRRRARESGPGRAPGSAPAPARSWRRGRRRR